MKTLKKKRKSSKGLIKQNHLGCPLTLNRSFWCFGLCIPDSENRGHCGRIAPHGLKGRTQLAIEGHKNKSSILTEEE